MCISRIKREGLIAALIRKLRRLRYVLQLINIALTAAEKIIDIHP